MIDPDGEQLGIMSIHDARRAAEDRELDLIEVAPNARPPVCRIMDWGKFRYEQRKKSKEAQKKSRQTEMKMLRVRPNTDDHDIGFKMRNARKFLAKGKKVKFTVIFRGPELRHREIGEQQLKLFIEGCKDLAQVDQPPRMEGRRMTMVLEPRPDIARQLEEQARSEAGGAAEQAPGEEEEPAPQESPDAEAPAPDDAAPDDAAPDDAAPDDAAPDDAAPDDAAPDDAAPEAAAVEAPRE